MSERTVYDIPVDDLELSVRSTNCLKYNGITSLGHLIDYFTQHSKSEALKKIKNFGVKSYYEVMEIVRQHQSPEPPPPRGPTFWDFVEPEARKRDWENLHTMLLYSIAVSAKRIADKVCADE